MKQKTTIKFFAFLLLISISCHLKSQTKATNPASRTCGTGILPDKFETYVQKWISKLSAQKNLTINYTLPVVIHIIHNGEAIGTGANISNAQAVSQIDVLNEDYDGLNADSSLIPSAFVPLFAHCGINFCLATIDTSGVAMSEQGIDRIDRSTKGWIAGLYTQAYIDSVIKPNSIWNPNKYLNIWCLELGSSLLGFATFPDSALTGLGGLDPYDPNAYDGVVILNTAFGNTGTATAPNDKGRTATHEVGHWLGLRHIWGDNMPNCGNDFVADTPGTDTSNFGCPTFPYHPNNICGTNSDGEMFMNYMDYVDDACMQMFSNGQATRMLAILNGSPMRMNLAASIMCGAVGISEVFSENTFSIYPNPNTGTFIISTNNTSKQTLQIFDVSGRLVLNQIIEGKTTIDSGNLNEGVYNVCITGKEGIANKKIVIVK